MDKSKKITLIAMALNIILLAALITSLLHLYYTTAQPAEALQAGPSAPEDEAEVMGAAGDGGEELEQWIANMKALAEKHGVDAYFLQELFPENIVYSFRGKHVYAEVDDTLPQHSYNWDHLVRDENGVLNYSEEGGLQGIFGIDISKYQGDINWQKVKDAGVGFVIIRVGYRGYESGEIMEDEYLQSYLAGASEAGLPIGLYFFSQAVDETEAVEEAEYILNVAASYEITYPIVFDMEEMETSPYRTENMTAENITDVAIAFCERVREAGHTPMIYGNVSWFMARMDLHRLDGYDKWFAQYRPMPWYPYDFTMWQYSPRGEVDGIEGEVDMNISFVDYAAA